MRKPEALAAAANTGKRRKRSCAVSNCSDLIVSILPSGVVASVQRAEDSERRHQGSRPECGWLEADSVDTKLASDPSHNANSPVPTLIIANAAHEITNIGGPRL
jgi:hypothetical protein